MKLVSSVLAAILVPIFIFSTSFIPNNSEKVPQLPNSELLNYKFEYTNAGYKIYGNNLFINNETRKLADVDNSDVTNNSSAVKLPGSLNYSDAILIYALNTTTLNANKQTGGVLVSNNGFDYAYKTVETFGSLNGHTVGITQLSSKDLRAGSAFYFSLPLLEDSENLSKVNMAGWYLVLLDSSGDTIQYLVLSSALGPGEVTTALSLENGTLEGIAAPAQRIPSDKFTKLGDVIAERSKSGNFGLADTGFLYLETTNSGTPRPGLSTTKVLEQGENNPNDTFEISLSLPLELRDAPVKIGVDTAGLYILNSAVIPFGAELSGPLTDTSGDDVLTVDKNMFTLEINSGSYQLNKVNNTKIKFSFMHPTRPTNIKPTITYETGGSVRTVSGNYLEFSHLSKWKDVSMVGYVEVKSKTRANIILLVNSTEDLGNNGIIKFNLPEFVAVEENTLRNKNCKVIKNVEITCQVSIKAGVSKINVEVLTRRLSNEIDFGSASIDLVGDYADANYSNNVAILEELISDN